MKLTQKNIDKFYKTNEDEFDDEIVINGNKLTRITADWKESPGSVAEGFIKAIRKLGGEVFEDPQCRGSDTYGWLILVPDNTEGA